MWMIKLGGEAIKDARKIKNSPWAGKVQKLLAVIAINPFQSPPPYEKLAPPTAETYSRRINRQHRLVYKVFKEQGIVRILRMWTHYE